MIPSLILKKLYTFGSLRNAAEGVAISLKNRLSDVVLTRVVSVRIGPLDLRAEDLELDLGEGQWQPATAVTADRPEPFPLKPVSYTHLTLPTKRIV